MAGNVLEKFRLDGNVALITGGTRGIGLATAHAFGQAGAKLYLSARREQYEDAGALLGAGYEVRFYSADLATRAAAKSLVDKVVGDAGRIDILVNNAGVGTAGNTVDFTEQEWRETMATNVDAVFWCSQAAVASMRRTGGGTIVNVGSMSGIISNIPQNQVAYNSSKAAVHMMTKALAVEWAKSGVRVNALAPGYVGTEMTLKMRERPELFNTWIDMTPMGRLGTPQEIASAILFLASPASNYVTGAILSIDGGYTAW
ncbi:MAG: glucose 1-dehydrogenase [Mesorhizobium sp.]|nr:MAG: glucose 1-dehydrogenase [Mesorhizobium sp.]